MTGSDSKYLEIKIKTDNGAIIKIKDENEIDAIEVSTEEAERIQQSPDVKNVAMILHIHASPGCIYVVKANGQVVKICR